MSSFIVNVENLGNVKLNLPVVNGQTLIFDSTDRYWKNQTITTGPVTGAPVNASYLVIGTTNPTLTQERVATGSATINIADTGANGTATFSVNQGALDLALLGGFLPFNKGGTGLTTLGSPGQALVVNETGTALEYGNVAAGSGTGTDGNGILTTRSTINPSITANIATIQFTDWVSAKVVIMAVNTTSNQIQSTEFLCHWNTGMGSGGVEGVFYNTIGDLNVVLDATVASGALEIQLTNNETNQIITSATVYYLNDTMATGPVITLGHTTIEQSVAASTTATVDNLNFNTFFCAKWLITLTNATDIQSYELHANYTTGMSAPSFTKYGEIGDTFNHDLTHSIVGSLFNLRLINNTGSSFNVSVIRYGTIQ